jgi:hypothetical protein
MRFVLLAATLAANIDRKNRRGISNTTAAAAPLMGAARQPRFGKLTPSWTKKTAADFRIEEKPRKRTAALRACCAHRTADLVVRIAPPDPVLRKSIARFARRRPSFRQSGWRRPWWTATS